MQQIYDVQGMEEDEIEKWKELTEQINSLDIKELPQCVCNLFFGITGCGKSTLLSHFVGHQLSISEEDDGYQITHNQKSFKIGDQMSSCTKGIEIEKYPFNKNWLLFDCQGFQETDGPHQDLQFFALTKIYMPLIEKYRIFFLVQYSEIEQKIKSIEERFKPYFQYLEYVFQESLVIHLVITKLPELKYIPSKNLSISTSKIIEDKLGKISIFQDIIKNKRIFYFYNPDFKNQVLELGRDIIKEISNAMISERKSTNLQQSQLQKQKQTFDDRIIAYLGSSYENFLSWTHAQCNKHFKSAVIEFLNLNIYGYRQIKSSQWLSYDEAHKILNQSYSSYLRLGLLKGIFNYIASLYDKAAKKKFIDVTEMKFCEVIKSNPELYWEPRNEQWILIIQTYVLRLSEIEIEQILTKKRNLKVISIICYHLIQDANLILPGISLRVSCEIWTLENTQSIDLSGVNCDEKHFEKYGQTGGSFQLDGCLQLQNNNHQLIIKSNGSMGRAASGLIEEKLSPNTSQDHYLIQKIRDREYVTKKTNQEPGQIQFLYEKTCKWKDIDDMKPDGIERFKLKCLDIGSELVSFTVQKLKYFRVFGDKGGLPGAIILPQNNKFNKFVQIETIHGQRGSDLEFTFKEHYVLGKQLIKDKFESKQENDNICEINGILKAVGSYLSLRFLAKSLTKMATEVVSKSLVYGGSGAVVLLATLYNCNFNYEIIEKTDQEEKISQRVIQTTIRKLKFNIKILNKGLSNQVNFIKHTDQQWQNYDSTRLEGDFNSLKDCIVNQESLCIQLSQTSIESVQEKMVKIKAAYQEFKVEQLLDKINNVEIIKKIKKYSLKLKRLVVKNSELNLENLKLDLLKNLKIIERDIDEFDRKEYQIQHLSSQIQKIKIYWELIMNKINGIQDHIKKFRIIKQVVDEMTRITPFIKLIKEFQQPNSNNIQEKIVQIYFQINNIHICLTKCRKSIEKINIIILWIFKSKESEIKQTLQNYSAILKDRFLTMKNLIDQIQYKSCSIQILQNIQQCENLHKKKKIAEAYKIINERLLFQIQKCEEAFLEIRLLDDLYKQKKLKEEKMREFGVWIENQEKVQNYRKKYMELIQEKSDVENG